MMYVPRRLFSGFLIVLLIATSSCPAGVWLAFRSPTSMHISYDQTSPDAGYYFSNLRLHRVDANGNSLEVIKSSSDAANNFADISGKLKLAVPWGQSVYFAWAGITTGGEEWQWYTDEAQLYDVSYVLNKVGGITIFDDSMTSAPVNPLPSDPITIGANTTLTVGAVTVSDPGEVNVYGTLVADAGAGIASRFIFHTPHALTDPPGSEFVFAAGSSGSSIDGAQGNLIRGAMPGLTIANSHNIRVTVPAGGRLTMTNSQASTLSITLNAGAFVCLTNCWCQTFEIGGITINGTFDANQCMFEGGAFIGGTGTGLVSFDGCEFIKTYAGGRSQFALLMDGDIDPEFNNCTFRGIVKLSQNTTCRPTFTGCEFADELLMPTRNRAVVQSCVFRLPLVISPIGAYTTWVTDTSPNPTITGNSFLGREAIVWRYGGTGLFVPPGAEIPIGANYYGDPKGPRKADAKESNRTEPPFLAPRGGIVTHTLDGKPVFAVPGFSSSGSQRADTSVPPQVWLNGWVYGQITVSHANHGVFKNSYGTEMNWKRMGKDTLLSLDLVATDQNLTDVKVFAKIDGVDIGGPENNPLVLHRDLSAVKNTRLYNGEGTVNFVIPPVKRANPTLEVILDTTDAIDGGGVSTILSTPLSFIAYEEGYGVALKILVQPVRLFVPGLPNNTPSGAKMQAELEKLIPLMTPLRPGEFEIGTAPTHLFGLGALVAAGNYFETLQGLTTTALVNTLSVELMRSIALNRIMGRTTLRGKPDLVVVVMPRDSMKSGGDPVLGQNLRWCPDFLFVDETSAESMFHEWGHYLGLWRSPEQYAQYPDHGIEHVNVTLFKGTTVENVMPFAPVSRVLHLPTADVFWFNKDTQISDIMGNRMSLWPIADTLAHFKNSLGSYYNPSAAERGTDAGRNTGNLYYDPVQPGRRRIMMTGKLTEVTGQTDPDRGWIIEPGTVRAFDLTDVATGVLEPGTISIASAVKYNAYGNYYLRIVSETMWDDGWYLRVPDCALPADHEEIRRLALDLWRITIDMPDDTTRLELYKRTGMDYSVWPLIYELDVTPPPATSVSVANDNGGLDTTAALSWQTDGRATTTSGLMQLLLVQAEADGEWSPVGFFDSAQSVDLGTEFLQPGSSISFRVVTSGGIGSSEAVVSGLTVSDRPPTVELLSPQGGDSAETGTPWTLAVNAWDIEDGILTGGSWTSSLDGALGTGLALDGVTLSDGTHDLAYSVHDSFGNTATAQVQVTVGPMTDYDLALSAESIAILEAGRDHLSGEPDALRVGTNYEGSVTLRNTGRETTCDLVLYLTRPGSAREELARRELALAPFEQATATGGFTVAAIGTYKLEGAIEDAGRGDTNAENDTAARLFSTVQIEVFAGWNLVGTPVSTQQAGAEFLRNALHYRLYEGVFWCHDGRNFVRRGAEKTWTAGDGLWVWSPRWGLSRPVFGQPPAGSIHLDPGWSLATPTAPGLWPDRRSVRWPLWCWNAAQQVYEAVWEQGDGLELGRAYWFYVINSAGYDFGPAP